MPNLDSQYDIDERYRAFEDHHEGILVSLAGPGTGKTFSILRRLSVLLRTDDVESHAICYITFIRDISEAFRSDFDDNLGREDGIEGQPRITTLHSLACRLIRNRGFSIGYDGELFFTSVAPFPDTFESKVFLNDLASVLNSPSLNTIARVRNALMPVKQVWRDASDTQNLSGLEAVAHAGYLGLSRAYRLIDWDHTIPIAHELYQVPENRQSWLTSIGHYLVDEYQDFNRAEQLLISAIISAATSAVIVGDDDQSLFGGRGGSPDGLRELFRSADVDQVSMVRCRRCGSNIVQHANTFLSTMSPNPRRMLALNEGGSVESLRFKSAKAEVEFLAQFLDAAIGQLPAEPHTRDGIVCLFPTKESLRFYFEKLSEYVQCYTTRLEIEDSRRRLIHALSLSARPTQRFSERLLLENFPQIKFRHRRTLANIVLERDISPTEACQLLINEGELTGLASQAAADFIAMCSGLTSQDPELIADQIEYWTEVERPHLINLIASFLSSLQETDQETAISDFCDAAIPSIARPPEDRRAILFLTIHGAKGLTKRTVVMPGLEDAWLPGRSKEASLEEKRRLFYVALTRATHQVLITHPATRARGDPMNYSTPGRSKASRFVRESGIQTRFHE